MNATVDNSTLTVSDLGIILNDVNKIRLAVGIGEGKLKELPEGIPEDAEQCVLANALSNGWEAEVDSAIRLKHIDHFETEEDELIIWERTVNALNKRGFNAFLEDNSYHDDCNAMNCWCNEDRAIVINTTPLMRTLITEFDRGLLPSLILEDVRSDYIDDDEGDF